MWLVGAGLASMSTALFMIRDGQLPGGKITILERLALPGGALDGVKKPTKGFVIAAAARWKTTWNACGTTGR